MPDIFPDVDFHIHSYVRKDVLEGRAVYKHDKTGDTVLRRVGGGPLTYLTEVTDLERGKQYRVMTPVGENRVKLTWYIEQPDTWQHQYDYHIPLIPTEVNLNQLRPNSTDERTFYKIISEGIEPANDEAGGDIELATFEATDLELYEELRVRDCKDPEVLDRLIRSGAGFSVLHDKGTGYGFYSCLLNRDMLPVILGLLQDGHAVPVEEVLNVGLHLKYYNTKLDAASAPWGQKPREPYISDLERVLKLAHEKQPFKKGDQLVYLSAGRYPSLIPVLFRMGFSLNYREGETKETAVHRAAENLDLDGMMYLMDLGADFDLSSADGTSGWQALDFFIEECLADRKFPFCVRGEQDKRDVQALKNFLAEKY